MTDLVKAVLPYLVLIACLASRLVGGEPLGLLCSTVAGGMLMQIVPGRAAAAPDARS